MCTACHVEWTNIPDTGKGPRCLPAVPVVRSLEFLVVVLPRLVFKPNSLEAVFNDEATGRYSVKTASTISELSERGVQHNLKAAGQVLKCGVPPSETAVTSNRQRQDIQLDASSCRGPIQSDDRQSPIARSCHRQLDVLCHRWRHTQHHWEKTTKARARQRLYDHWHPRRDREGAHGAVAKPAHWSRQPATGTSHPGGLSTLQLTCERSDRASTVPHRAARLREVLGGKTPPLIQPAWQQGQPCERSQRRQCARLRRRKYRLAQLLAADGSAIKPSPLPLVT